VRVPAKTTPYRGDVGEKPAEDPREAKPEDKEKDDPKASIAKLLGGIDGVKGVADAFATTNELGFQLATSKDCRAEVSRAIIEAKLDLLKLDFARSELESTFIRLVGGEHAGN
jgi:hypothetical protein